MPVESVLRIALADVQRLSFECSKCGAVLSLAKGHWERQEKCASCGGDWRNVATIQELHDLDIASAAIPVLRRLADQKGLPFILHLEITAPEK